MAVDDQLRIDVADEGERVVVRLVGELDLASTPGLEGVLESPVAMAAAMLVIDLQGLEFLDSTGLRVLLSTHERSKERGQAFAVTRSSPQVQRLFSITRVDEHLPTIT